MGERKIGDKYITDEMLGGFNYEGLSQDLQEQVDNGIYKLCGEVLKQTLDYYFKGDFMAIKLIDEHKGGIYAEIGGIDVEWLKGEYARIFKGGKRKGGKRK